MSLPRHNPPDQSATAELFDAVARQRFRRFIGAASLAGRGDHAPTPPPCDKCGAAMIVLAHMPPVSMRDESRTIYQCEACDVTKWIEP